MAVVAHPDQGAQPAFRIALLPLVGKGDHHRGPVRMGAKRFPHMAGGFGHHRPTAFPAMKHPEPGKEQLYVVGDLGHRPDGGPGRSHRFLPVDGDGRRNPLDPADAGAVHPVHELAGIGRECLHVATLALGIEGVEGQGGFARTADAGHHGDGVQGNVQVEVLEIVLPRTADANGFHGCQFGQLCQLASYASSAGFSDLPVFTGKPANRRTGQPKILCHQPTTKTKHLSPRINHLTLGRFRPIRIAC